MRVGGIRAWAVAVLGVCAVFSAAWAQLGTGPRERYERRTRGVDIDDIVKDLRSEEGEKRLEAVRRLGESGEPGAVQYLVGALGDPDVRVRAKALDMLAQMRATEATPVLVQYLFLRTTDRAMKKRILAALGEIGDVRAAKPIVDFLRRDLDPESCGTALFALGEIGAPEAEPVLREFAQTSDDPTLRRLAREALAKVERRQAAVASEAKEPAETFLQPRVPR
ncbi:MAG: hypothetical protein KatS3mg076_1419 [Candidatus Binatia bacterium]|nr:MAG: hypothetical protein KatS3mg076_1419 [Candidatus Binatia bacterium]